LILIYPYMFFTMSLLGIIRINVLWIACFKVNEKFNRTIYHFCFIIYLNLFGINVIKLQLHQMRHLATRNGIQLTFTPVGIDHTPDSITEEEYRMKKLVLPPPCSFFYVVGRTQRYQHSSACLRRNVLFFYLVSSL
jgi:hypothetical protein